MASKRFSKSELFSVRNSICFNIVLDFLRVPNKAIEGMTRFLCPKCNEFRTAINPKTNLARCFRCKENFNTIDITMEVQKINFVDSVKLLKGYFL
jgi:DNA primase